MKTLKRFDLLLREVQDPVAQENFARLSRVIEELRLSLAGLSIKSGLLATTEFAGTPLKASVVFTTPFPNTNYTISALGLDSRSFSYESKTRSGFVLNTNSNTALTGEISWQAIQAGES